MIKSLAWSIQGWGSRVKGPGFRPRLRSGFKGRSLGRVVWLKWKLGVDGERPPFLSSPSLVVRSHLLGGKAAEPNAAARGKCTMSAIRCHAWGGDGGLGACAYRSPFPVCPGQSRRSVPFRCGCRARPTARKEVLVRLVRIEFPGKKNTRPPRRPSCKGGTYKIFPQFRREVSYTTAHLSSRAKHRAAVTAKWCAAGPLLACANPSILIIS